MKIDQKKSPNYTKGRNGWKPDIIVCHITEGNYSGAVSWLSNKISGVSANFVLSRKGEITQLVDIKDTSWANGTSTDKSDKKYYGQSSIEAVKNRKTNANYYTISIECEGFTNQTGGNLTDIQRDTLVELIKYIIKEVKTIYNVNIPIDRNHIIGHYQISPITKPNCPGKLFPWDKVIKQLTSKLQILGDDEMVDTGKFQIDGKIYEIDRILKDDENYVKLSDLKKAGFNIYYDSIQKIPIVKSPVV